MLVADHIARRVARIIYEADCHTRNLQVKQLSDFNERSYLGSVTGIAAVNLLNIGRYSKDFHIRIDSRDTHSYDGVFVFRFKEEVKIGVCECKLLRFTDDYCNLEPLSKTWDSKENFLESHFFNQVTSFNNWSDECAKWYMFMLDLPQGIYAPPLDVYGSSCVWHTNMNDHIRKQGINKHHIWNLQDVINIGQPPLINLQKVIHEILICKAGKKILIDPVDFTASVGYGDGQREIKVPLPQLSNRRREVSFSDLVDEFLKTNNLSFYRYYNFPQSRNLI